MKLNGPFTAIIVLILILCGMGSGWLGFRFRDESNFQITCFNNMRMLSGAKGSFGLENRLARGQRVSVQQLSLYFKDGGKGVRCPAGGTYEAGLFTGDKDMGNIIHAPSCTIHGSLVGYGSNWNPSRPPNPYFAFSIACFVIALLIILRHLTMGGGITRRHPDNAARPAP